MLGSGLEERKPGGRYAEGGSEAFFVGLLPNWEVAVNAAALLREEGSGTKFGQS